MIKIKRFDCPECLQINENEFSENCYRLAGVIETLYDMQHGKCCYCERSLSDLGTTERHVDHYRPQCEFRDDDETTLWHLANRWENLLYACVSCNSRKGSQSPFNTTTGECEIVDPSCNDVDPEEHIEFIIDGAYVAYDEGTSSDLGRTTINKLKFAERTDLFGSFRKRKDEIEKTFTPLINALLNSDHAELTLKKNGICKATHP